MLELFHGTFLASNVKTKTPPLPYEADDGLNFEVQRLVRLIFMRS
jgi:hypothetical protein